MRFAIASDGASLPNDRGVEIVEGLGHPESKRVERPVQRAETGTEGLGQPSQTQDLVLLKKREDGSIEIVRELPVAFVPSPARRRAWTTVRMRP
jgi:hypothetical protein